jgi:hypothetical protein
MRILLALCGVLASLAAGTSAFAQGYVPIGPGEARLLIAQSAFGNIAASRSVYQTGAARYERWNTGIDTNRRFYQIILREAEPLTVVLENLDLQQTARDSLGDAGAGLHFEPAQFIQTNLGPAEYARFNLGAIACASFHITFGEVVRGYPANVVKGIYCDPAELRLPDYDIGNTLNAIGVVGWYEPPPPPPPVIITKPLPPPTAQGPIYSPDQPFPTPSPPLVQKPVPVVPLTQPFPEPRVVIPNPFPTSP